MTSSPRLALVLALAAALAACQPMTTRPAFAPLPEAAATEIRLETVAAVDRLAEALRQDSIPIIRVERRDGYLDSGWFDSATGKPASGRPMGPNVVRVRAWVNPARPYFSQLIVEAVYRPLADPSLPERELDRPVPEDHPIAAKIRAALEAMVKQYGGPPAATESQGKE